VFELRDARDRRVIEGNTACEVEVITADPSRREKL
jgi:hypothetical protein